jgi:fibronectin-binding autotransporter adhesin
MRTCLNRLSLSSVVYRRLHVLLFGLRLSLLAGLSAMVIAGVTLPTGAAVLTWDGDTGTGGLQDGGGTWNTTDTNRWWNGSSYQAWNSATPDAATFGVGSGAAGTVTLGGPITVGSVTFNAAGSGSYTISGNTLTLSGSPTITVASGQNATITSTLAGTAFTKAGDGTLSINTVVGYSGTTIVSGGTLKLGGTYNILGGGRDVSVLSGATLYADTWSQNIRNVTLSGGTLAGDGGNCCGSWLIQSITVTAGSGTSTISSLNVGLSPLGTGVIDVGSGAQLDVTGTIWGGGGTNMPLIKAGSGVLRLLGANSYTASTTINAGTLTVNTLANGGVNSSIGASSNVATNLVLNGGTLQYTGPGATTDRLFSVGTSGGTIDASGTGAVAFTNTGAMGFNGQTGARTLTLTGTNTGANTLAALIGDSGGATSLVKSGTGTWVLTHATNTYTGTTTVNAGTLVVGAGNALGTGSLIINSGTVRLQTSDYNSLSYPTAPVTIGAGGVLSADQSSKNAHNLGPLTLNGGTLTSINGPGGAADDGGYGNFLLRGVTVGGSSMSTISSTTLTIVSGSFDVNDVVAGADLTISSRIISGSLIKNSSGTLVLTGANTYAGATTVSNGTLTWGNNSAFGSAAVTLGDANTGSGSVTLLASGSSRTLSNNIVVQNYGTAVTIGSSSGSVDVHYNGSLTLNRAVTMQCVASDRTDFNNISGNPGLITITGGGRAIWGGTSTFTGDVSITGSGTTLQVQAAQLPVNTNVTVGAGAVLQSYLSSPSLNGLSGTGALKMHSANTAAATWTLGAGAVSGTFTFDGTISDGGTGAVSIAKTGSGTQVLTGSSSYTGATTVAGGTLSVTSLANGGANSSIGASSNVAANLVLNGGSLRYTGSGSTTDRLFSLGTSGGTIDASGTGAAVFTNTGDIGLNGQSGTRTLTLTGTNTGDNTLALKIVESGGATSLVKSGTGTWVLTHGTNGFTGTTNVVAGTLKLATDYNMLINSSSVAVQNGATLVAVDRAQHIRALTLNGGTLSGAGNEYGSWLFNQDVTVSGGANTSTLSATNMAIKPAAGVTFTVGSGATNGIDLDVTGTIFDSTAGGTDNGGFTKAGAGVMRLSGANTYTAKTTVTGGKLSISADNNLGTAPATATAGHLVLNGGTLQATASFSLNANRGIAVGPTSGSGSGTIEVTGSNTLTYDGILANNSGGSGGLTKTGTGTLVLRNLNNSYTGPTVIAQGTLQLVNNPVATTLPVGSATLWLDATNPDMFSGSGSTLVWDNSGTGDFQVAAAGAGVVTRNASGAGPNGNAYVNLNGTASNGTTYLTLQDGSGAAATISDARTLFFVFTPTAQPGGFTAFFGRNAVEGGNYMATSSGNGYVENTYGAGGLKTNVTTPALWFENAGALADATTAPLNVGANNYRVVDVVAGSAVTFDNLGSDRGSAGRCLPGNIGEVLVYNTALTTAERQAVEAYLMYKWLGITAPGFGQGSLPATTALEIAGGATLDLNGQNQTIASLADYGGSGGTVANTATGKPVTLTIGTASGSTTFSGVIADGTSAISLVKTGDSTQVLTGSNSYSGATSVQGGTLAITGGGKLYANAGWGNRSVSVTNGGILQFDNWVNDGIGPFNYSAANLVLNGGTLRYVGGSNNPSSQTDIYSGRAFTIGAGGATLEAATSGATWEITRYGGTDAYPLASNGGTLTLTGAGNGQMDKVIPGTGGLVKSGTGTWTLTAANTYSGTTLVSEGTLRVNGSIAGTGGDVTVAGGATLGGTGTIVRNVIAEEGAILAPGTSPGTLAIVGSLSLADTSLLDFELADPNLGDSPLSDRIDVDGDLTLDGVLDVTPLAGFGTPVAGDQWRLFNYTGSLTDNVLELGSLPSLGPALFYTIDTSVLGQVNLMIGVPEPSSLVLAGVGMLGLVLLRRLRRRK